MKLKIFVTCLFLALFSCQNMDIEFDDFGVTACYFPVQLPARTLILGNYELGYNDNDNNHQFEIGATLSGLYKNKLQRKYYYEVDESLLDQVANVLPLPKSYYSIVTESPVTIPAGDMKGRILVKLTDAFFTDQKSIAEFGQVNYVIPLRITEVENIDTVLSGTPAVQNPIHVYSPDWRVEPKDYVLYGIKYINKYDASYLRRGVDRVEENSTEVVYHNDYMVRDEIVRVSSASLNSVTLENRIRRDGQATPGNINLKLVFDEADNCSVFNSDTDELIGTGSFMKDSEYGIWNEKTHDVIFLKYTYFESDNNETHHVYDTLVYRNRNVKYEEFTVELTKD